MGGIMMRLHAGRAAIGGSFTPSDLASLKAQYIGDDVSGANGASVATWPDHGGTYNATGGNGTNPAVVVPGLNGHRTVGQAGSIATAALTMSSSLMNGETAGSLFSVMKAAADPPTVANKAGAAWDGFTNDTGASKSSNHPFSDSNIYEHFGTDTRKTVGDPTPSLASWRFYSAHSAANDYRAYLDGTSIFSTATNTVNFGTVARFIFKNLNNSMYAGEIAEICIFNSALTTGDRQKVEGYLAWKYGLQAQLPVGHPYLSAAP